MKKSLIAFLFILASLTAYARNESGIPPTLPVHVLTMELRDEGALDLVRTREDHWWDLRPATAQEQAAALREPDSIRESRLTGRLAVTGSDASGQIIFRTIAPVQLKWRITEDANVTTVHDPLFILAVPEAVQTVAFEGWSPQMHGTFELRKAQRFHPETDVVGCAQPTGVPLEMKTNMINMVVVAEGYLDTTPDRNLFNADYGAFVKRLFQTEPFRRYSYMFNVQPYFAVSCDRGAFHPPSCGPGATAGAQNWRSALRSTYCGDNATDYLLTYDQNAWVTNVAPHISGNPEMVVILVNDLKYGGSGAPFAVVAVRSNGHDQNAYAPLTALNLLGHLWPAYLGAEYSLAVGYPGCTNNCPKNVMYSPGGPPALSAVEWARWLSPGYPTCGSSCNAAEHVSGLFQGAMGSNNYWRSEKNCLMRQSFIDAAGPTPVPPPTYFCNVCTELLIRAFYSRFDPFAYVLTLHEERSIRNAPLLTLRPVLPNSELRLGITMPVLAPPDLNYTWRKGFRDGEVIPGQTGYTYDYFALLPGTESITLEVEDPTPMVREDATHQKPFGMHKFYTWQIECADPLSWEIHPVYTPLDPFHPIPIPFPKRPVTVPKNTRTLNLRYSVKTSEVGRAGDQWHIAVGFGGPGASELTAQENLYYIENTAANPQDNVTDRLVKIDIGNAARNGPVTVVMEIGGKAGETEGETELPTTVTATLSAAPTGCGDQCDYCDTHPNDPSCPLSTSISAVALPIPDTDRTHNHGDSSYSSLGERIHEGRYVRVTIPSPAKTSIREIHFTADAVRTLDNVVLSRVRNNTWYPGVNETDIGIAYVGQSNWEFNISPKVQYVDDGIVSIPVAQDLWSHTIKYRITATITTFDDRVVTSSTEVDSIISGSTPTDKVLLPRPLHALWHTPYASAQTQHPWASIFMHQWLKFNHLPLNFPDRIADEDAVDGTATGHEFGSGITERAFYPQGGYWDTSAYRSAYPNFRATAVKALDSNPNIAERESARAVLITWIENTRSHLDVVLDDRAVTEVWIGNGSKCGATFNDSLPDRWMYDLLLTGRISTPTATLLDVSASVSGNWNRSFLKLFDDCVHNYHIDIRLDRCLTGELPHGPCSTGRTVIVRPTTITTPPASSTIDAGQTAHLQVVADGSNLRYQWYQGEVYTYQWPLVDRTLDEIEVQPAESTSYWVLVTGDDGVAGAGATIFVNGTAAPCTTPPSIEQQPPVDQTISANQAAFLAVTATGSNLHYQWYSYDPDGNPLLLAGATLSSYTTTDPGIYFVRISNACGSVDSDLSYVLFGSHCIVPSALQYGATSTSITLGESTTLGLFPEGPPPITVTWYEISPDIGYPVPIGDGTSITVTPAVDAMQYQAILQNDCGARETVPITIHVCTPVVITQQPVPPTPFINNGQSATLHVEATGTNLHYHWTAGGAPYGTDSPDLTITPQPGPVYYACRVDNECSHADSNEILVAPPCPQLTASVLPETGSLASGQSLTLEVTTTGEGALSYQWSQKLPGASAFTDIAGATGTSLVVSPTVDQTQYRARVSNGCGSADSNAVTITVTPCLPATIVSTTGDSVTLGQASTVSVSATGTDLHYEWFAGNPPDTSNPLATTTPSLTLTLNNPTTYWARVTALCGSPANSGPIAVHVCTTPLIATPPQSTSVFSGGSATLSVSATEGTSEPMHYQWFKGVSSPVAVGTDSPSYTTGALTSETQYWVRVTAGSCSADSSAATVSICPLPQSVAGAPNQNTSYGQSVRLQLGALPGASGYAWFRGSSGDTSFPLSGGFQAANYFDVDPQVTTSYWAQVQNGIQNGSCVSNTTTTTVNVCIPTITTPPASVMINSGQSATLSVAANTTGLTYQWYLGASPSTTTPISGATGSSLTVSPSSTSSYWVRVTGSCGVAANSSTAVVTICAPPAVTTPPQGASIVRGQSATLSVNATGTNLTYQWYQGPSGNTTIPLGSTSASISVSPQNPADYWVKVSGSCGTVNSAAAHVSVCLTPSISAPPQNTSVFSGSAAALSVTASEATTEPMHYQWFKGVSSPVAICSDSASCNTGALTAQTQFWVRVTAGSCAVDSAAATVSICPLPASVSGPPNANSSPNQTVRLQFGSLPGATGYAWYRGSSGDTSFPLSGGFQAANYFDVSPSVTTNYWAQVQNGSCVSSSTTTTVNVCIPTIQSHPSGSTITSGSSAPLSVTSSLPGSTYQWYVGASGTTTAPVSGATSASVTVSPSSTTTYWCRVSGSCGSANSNAATITVCSPPQITQQPANASPSQRNYPTGLAVTATGTSLTYQWYLGASGDTSQPISGQTSATFTLNAVNSERYWVRVSGMCGSVNSNAAWISVYPVMVQQPQAASMSYGSTATFTVQASGTYLHYTWRDSTGQPASGGTDSPTYRSGSIYANTSFYCDITSSLATTSSSPGYATICDGPGLVSMPVTSSGSCKNIVVNSDRPIDNYLWYQGPRGNTSTLVSQGANEYYACPATSTTYWCRLVAGNCYTDSPAITVP